MNIQTARGVAARIWAEPQHSDKAFDPDLAESIAQRLVDGGDTISLRERANRFLAGVRELRKVSP